MTLPAGTNTTPESNPNSFSMLDDPGNVNPPAIFEPNSDFTQGIPQLWLASSGGEFWGGAVVWISLDGITYHPIGDIENPARQGQVVGGGELNVGLRGSNATIELDVTHDDATFGRTLCWITDNFETDAPCDGELLAYGAAVAGPLPFLYALGDLNRGLYGSTISDHPAGSLFTRIDTAASIGAHTLTLLRYDLPADYIGITLYLKFQSFNRFGQSLQDLADVVAYTYTPCGRGHTGPFGVPEIPSSLECTPLSGAGAIWLSWHDNPTSDAVIHYELYRASGLGATFASASLLETTKGAVWVDAGLDALSEWTYFVKACNAIGCSDPSDPSECTATENTGLPLCDTPPEVGQALVWDGTEWCPADISDDDTCDMQDIYAGTSV